MITDPTTRRMKDETGHDCPACPTDARNIGANLHNLLGALDSARMGGDHGAWVRVYRKAAEARAALTTWQRSVDEHFEALHAWERP